jgi:hypothetical protein
MAQYTIPPVDKDSKKAGPKRISNLVRLPTKPKDSGFGESYSIYFEKDALALFLY